MGVPVDDQGDSRGPVGRIPAGDTDVKKIRMDNAGELAKSVAFKMWCDARGINRCPTPGYNHTMQARAEGAVCICKEHVRCFLKHVGMPYRFWPWALTQFVRV